MLSVTYEHFLLSVIMLSVVMLSVVMLSVVVPYVESHISSVWLR